MVLILASLCLLFHIQDASGHDVTPKDRHGTDSPQNEQLVCPAQRINYITDGLPQQCLRTPWSSALDDATSIVILPSVAVRDSQSAWEPSSTRSEVLEVTATVISQSYTSHIALGHDTIATQSVTSSSTPSHERQSRVVEQQPRDTAWSKTGEPEPDGDSPLDNANFLSFEEWKKQNLAKAGQSADNIGGSKSGTGSDGSRRRPGSINNALDSLGEDTELEIDFGGFVNPGSVTQTKPSSEAKEHDGSHTNKKDDQEQPKAHPRGKDAGKTCKERSNYASFDCAATILKTNKEIKGSTSILVENKDSYLLNECSAENKFFIVELCDDILIDTVVLANFEFFSSSFRTFRVSVSDRYPVKSDKWRGLGTYEARNSREVQAFLIENPQIWARYLRIELLTHYGNEYYCPISLLRVHGTTMMEEFNHDLKTSRGEDDSEGEIEVDEVAEKSQDIVTAVNFKEDMNASQDTPTTASPTSGPSDVLPTSLDPSGQNPTREPVGETVQDIIEAGMSPLPNELEVIFLSNSTLALICHYYDTPKESLTTTSATLKISHDTVKRDSWTTSAEQPIITTPSYIKQSSSVSTTASPSDPPSSGLSTFKSSGIIESLPSPHNVGQNAHSDTQRPSHPASSSRPATSATQPHASNPTTQESFFKSVHKRLQLLETNSTLSLQYIEEQSRILRDAFSKVEKRQLAKTSAFLETLNTTVLTEMREFRSQYDQLWQSTVLELSSQRTQSRQEILALSTRLSLLADEVVFQRRIAIMQFLLIIVCLGLVLFGRSPSSAATYLELPPMVQNAINRSSANLSRYTPSPNGSPSPTRPSSRYGFFGRTSPLHFRGPSDDSRLTPSEDSRSLTPD